MQKISVATSLYQSAPYLNEFYHRHVKSLEKMGVDYEFVFVDDGSPDNSVQVVLEMMKTLPKIKLVQLSRNFGQAAAMFAAMGHTTGDFVYTTDSDLEETPENIEKIWASLLAAPGVDVVYGVTVKRATGLVRGILGKAFYMLLDVVSTIKVPHDQTWQRIMSRRYVDSLLMHRESQTLPAGLMILTGFKQLPLLVEKTDKGKSSYSFRRRLTLAIDALFSFSPRPAVIISMTGLGISFASFIGVAFLIFKKLTQADYQAGWSSLIVSVWLVGGLVLASLGVLGIYIVKIFNQVKQRPNYIVKQIDIS